MNGIQNALRDAGLIKGEGIEDYTFGSEVKLPFGHTMRYKGMSCFNDMKYSVKTINAVRRNAVPLTVEQLYLICPSLKDDDEFRAYLEKHISDVCLISGTHNSELDGMMKLDEECYKLTDALLMQESIVAGFVFDWNTMSVHPYFNGELLQTVIKNGALVNEDGAYDKMFGFKWVEFGGDPDDYYTELTALEAIEVLRSKMEFIPLIVIGQRELKISHGRYKNKNGRQIEAASYPILGYLIQSDRELMKKLVFKGDSSNVKEDVYYIICENWKTDPGTYHLKRYDEWNGKRSGNGQTKKDIPAKKKRKRKVKPKVEEQEKKVVEEQAEEHTPEDRFAGLNE